MNACVNARVRESGREETRESVGDRIRKGVGMWMRICDTIPYFVAYERRHKLKGELWPIIKKCSFLVGVLGIMGNGLVFLTFWKERRKSVFHMQLVIANIITLSAAVFSAPSALRGR